MYNQYFRHLIDITTRLVRSFQPIQLENCSLKNQLEFYQEQQKVVIYIKVYFYLTNKLSNIYQHDNVKL